MPTPLSADLSDLETPEMEKLIAIKRMEAAGLDPMLIKIMTREMGLPVTEPRNKSALDELNPYYLGKVAGYESWPFKVGTDDWRGFASQYGMSKSSVEAANDLLNDYGINVPQGYESWYNRPDNRNPVEQILGNIFRIERPSPGIDQTTLSNYMKYKEYVDRFKNNLDADRPK